MTKKTATRLATYTPNASGATWKIYRCDPPMPATQQYNDHAEYETVVVSANILPYTGPETYIFGAAKKDDGIRWGVTDWCELPGSQKGTLDHEQVLADLGYDVIDSKHEPDQAKETA